ncbi:pyridoxal phosphate-dependent decarboxylase family protein [Aquimarina sp. 2201CG14-23]|uniref:pyridoxal phosphate-dependent decarboxylase family protein n=1 Tax=Aquimarina mycalae TaxID=3040073 RepID=UPI002477E009|nr:aminotransferase class I/II-fold pyridoxal phosphate-dependent enzyme [Aquimarina sp. 2201CG14-23]MDH7446428.1 aminotransferase class I/II-fold pyridoxal phosphate-dependent enzyme [Aquimarina sp. 2201CG14-23]
MTLDQPIAQFRAQLHQVADMVADMYTNIENQPVYNNPDPDIVRAMFSESIPKDPSLIEDILVAIKDNIIPNATKHYSPHFYPWVTSCASQASILGDFIATALNVNATTWMNAASASEIEKQVVQWVGQFSGYDSNASGVLLSGGSTANLTGLQVARCVQSKDNIAINGLKHLDQYTVYASEQTHFCIDKSINALGIGTKYLRKIATLSDFTIDVQKLEYQIKKDISSGLKPMCIVGNAGTVNTGAIDPLLELSALCEKYDMWFHIDAAYGGCAADIPLTNKLFDGFHKANSVAIDLHKWMFVPFEAGCILVKDKNQLRDTFSVIPEYQKFDYNQDRQVDFSEYSFQQSRNFKALKVWMNYKAYGEKKLKKAITNSIHLMNYLAILVKDSEDFELITHNLSIVCFRYIGNYNSADLRLINNLNLQLIKDAETDTRVFIRDTKLGDMVVLRACCTNFRREKKHIEYLIKVLRTLGTHIKEIN